MHYKCVDVSLLFKSTANMNGFSPTSFVKYLVQWTKMYSYLIAPMQNRSMCHLQIYMAKIKLFLFTSLCFSLFLADVKFTLYLKKQTKKQINNKKNSERPTTFVIVKFCKNPLFYGLSLSLKKRTLIGSTFFWLLHFYTLLELFHNLWV